MPVSFEAFGIQQLNVAERLELIERIWDSLPEQLDPSDVPAWHLVEIAKRRAEVESHPGLGKPWRKVLDRLEGGLCFFRSTAFRCRGGHSREPRP